MLEWYHLANYEGIYKINLAGEVLNIYRNSILKHHYKCGYAYVTLSKYGKSKAEAIHRLLALTFLPNPENKPCIDHINGDKSDNRLENLRWATYQENTNNNNTHQKISISIKQDWRNGRKFNYKKLCKPVLCVETGIVYASQKEAELLTYALYHSDIISSMLYGQIFTKDVIKLLFNCRFDFSFFVRRKPRS